MIHNSRQILILILLLAGCTQRPADTPSAEAPSADMPSVGVVDAAGDAIASDSEWNDRNADIYRFLLSELEEPTPDRIYFISTTPMGEWGETGNWATIPADELKSLPRAAAYRPANEAYLRDGHVLERDTNAKAWMRWISVKQWINETEVEVEEGVWCCPLGGGASTTIYKKVNEKWQIKKLGRSWIS